MRKIKIRIVGGLGNQLHCFAMGRAVAASNNAELVIDTESGFWRDPYGRRYMLDHLPGLRARKMPLFKFPGYRMLFKARLKLAKRLSGFLPPSRKLVIEETADTSYQGHILSTAYKSNPYFIGYWACHRYYAGVQDRLRAELAPPPPQAPEALALLEQIEATNSCMVHWRSYVEEVSVRHPALNDYYTEALRLIEARHPDAHFFVFSDRPDLIGKAIDTVRPNMTLVDLSSLGEAEQSLAEFYLMYRCKHAIIGDSTFSWWAAWLGDRAQKSVVAPGGLSPWGRDWAPPMWTLIEVQGRHERIAVSK